MFWALTAITNRIDKQKTKVRPLNLVLLHFQSFGLYATCILSNYHNLISGCLYLSDFMVVAVCDK